ncbi:MAG: phenylacetate--CoA ligase family protein, partial [Notoacmeibacter sp.]|nr:phenylacetate--CoA ligase family protein [Notoacmeibacter sp.]
FVDPKQVAQVMRRHPEILKARLVVTRDGASDAMTLLVEERGDADAAAIAATLREATKLSGKVEVAEAGTLPNDGKIIADERDYAG